ncbi:DMT family transporter [Sphingomonas sp. Leaf343]|uniref:DMT family transporter n=1 Tax=Sphingomonas sp. Leaf343 TaxID=1736345 RepID=UPI0006F61A10|nr:DMT family transporter [Sphingomonas sp. Leaf343]KQR80940.1 permease [Sphingomonas sp. Leaf343]
MTQSVDRLAPAILFRLLSVVLFAGMNACIKLGEVHGASLGELLFFRQAGAAVLVTAVIAAGPGLATIRTQRIGAHIRRAVVGLTGMMFVFSAIITLPLAEATALSFSTPIFATILGAIVLGEPTGWRRWAAVLTGFVGVVIVARPGGHDLPPIGIAYGLVAAVTTATVFILLRQIGRTERAQTTVWWFSVLSLIPLSVVYAVTAQTHDATGWAILAATGLFGGAAQLAMTASLRYGSVSLVVPMDYSSLLWATLLGWWLFGTLPGDTTWIGAPIIVASGLYIVWREQVRRRETTETAISVE